MRLRAVLDVNVLVSAFIAPFGFARALWLACQRGEFDLIVSDHIVSETDMKLRLPRIARRYAFAHETVDDYTEALRAVVTSIAVTPDDVQYVTGDLKMTRCSQQCGWARLTTS